MVENKSIPFVLYEKKLPTRHPALGDYHFLLPITRIITTNLKGAKPHVLCGAKSPGTRGEQDARLKRGSLLFAGDLR